MTFVVNGWLFLPPPSKTKQQNKKKKTMNNGWRTLDSLIRRLLIDMKHDVSNKPDKSIFIVIYVGHVN